MDLLNLPSWQAVDCEESPEHYAIHAVRLLSENVEQVRKQVRASLSDRQRRTLMKDRFLLLRRDRGLREQDRLIRDAWLAQFPRLFAAYWRKEEFYAVYEAHSQDEALARYFAWQDHVAQSRSGLFSYFETGFTGSFVEAANSLVRAIDRQGRGYSFDVLRARLLYGQHLLRQTKRRGPKTPGVLEGAHVDVGLVDAITSTREELPLLS